MANNGKLVFPVKFDLHSAVNQASGDIDAVLRRMQTQINSHPLIIKTKIDGKDWTNEGIFKSNTEVGRMMFKSVNMLAKDGSIETIRKEMSALILEWEKLSEKERTATDAQGKLSGRAKEIVTRYAELTAVINSNAKSLQQLVTESNKATAAQEKEAAAIQKRVAKSQELVAMLNAERTSLSAVSQQMKFYQQIADKHSFGSKEYQYATEQLKQLGAQYQRLQGILNKNTGNKGKDIINAENIKTTLRGAETSIDQVKVKLKALESVFKSVDVGSFGWRRATEEAARLNRVLDEMKAKTKESTDALRRQAAQLADMSAKEKAHDAAKGERRALAIAEQRRKAAGLLTKEQERQQRILKAEENTLNNIQRKLSFYQSKLAGQQFDSKGFAKTAKEIERLTRLLDEAKRKMAELTGQSTNGASKQAANARKVNEEYARQTTYLERLLRRMMVYASVGAIGQFLTKVRETTAQFELQRISLGAIIQDQNRANQLFSEIKNFALKSPLSIMDLTKYTKQLAAYKIGWNGVRTDTEELFDTTKRLADVAVGLGVDFQRIVLMYGQIRATGYLRASEVRQATEAGIPLVEELAAKLSKLNGEQVTAAQVMDMISKRAISFDMVKEVFDDMTSAGGIFYNMQEKQGNTLYGLWQKLGDAASLMYNEIGNTGWVNSAMKGFANTLMGLMRHWESFANVMVVLAGGFAAYKIKQSLVTVSTVALSKATRDLAMAKAQLNIATAQGNTATALSAQWSIKAAQANMAAARATNFWTAAKYKLIAATSELKAVVAGSWVTLLITAIIAVGVAIYNSVREANKLKNELKDIQAETVLLQNQSAGRFTELANEAVNAANGSRQQKEALEELSRVYGDILPQDALKLENLRKMKGHYDELTDSIREYIAVQQKEKAMNAISENYGTKINDASRTAIDSLEDELNIGRDVAAQIVGEMQRDIQEKLEQGVADFRTTGQKLQDAAKKYGVAISDNLARDLTTFEWHDNWYDWLGVGKATNEFDVLNQSLTDMNKEMSDLENTSKGMTGEYGRFLDKIKETNNAVANVKLQTTSGESVDRDSFMGQQMKANFTMKKAAELIQNDETLKKALQDKAIELAPEWLHLVDSVDPKNLMDITSINFDAIYAALGDKYPELKKRIQLIQEEWGNVAPTNATVIQTRTKVLQLANSFGLSMDKMHKYLWDGSGDVDNYLKTLKGQQEQLNARLKEKQTQLEHMSVLSKWWNKLMGKNIEADIAQMKKELAMLDKLVPYVTEYTNTKPDEGKNHKSGGGSKQDPRLQNLKEEISLYEKLYQEYKQYEKAVGSSKAEENMNRKAKATIDALAKKYGIGLPKTVKTLTSALEILYGKMAQLPKKVFPNLDKELKDFRWKIEEIDIDDSQKQIEEQLKVLQEKISQTKTAREFFDKILLQTGDVELATRVSLSLYGDTGKELFKNTVEQIRQIFKSGETEKDLEIEWELNNAIDIKNERINYNELAKIYEEYQDDIIEKNRETAKKIIEEGRKTVAANILNWEKEFAKAKKFEERKLELIRQAKAERDKIIHEVSDPVERDRLLKGSVEKQNRDMSQLNFEEFKNSEYYIEIFEDLGTKTTASLKQLRAEMQAIIDTDKNLSPENMKTLVKAMDDIDNEINGRGFGNTMVQSVKNYFQAVKDLKLARQELAAAQAEYDAQEPALDAAIDLARNEQDAAQQELNRLKSDELATDEQIVAAQLRLNQATENVQRAEQKKVAAKKKVANIEKKVTKEQDNQKKATVDLFGDLNKCGQAARNLAGMLGDVKDLLQVSDESAAGIVFDSAIQGLEAMATAIEIVTTAQAIFNAVSESNPWIAAAALILAVASALMMGIQNQKVAKANKEIERQQKLIDQLEYSLKKLEKAADKAFGGDFVRNIQQQLETLSAEYEAKQKQLEAEKSKGKKKDKNKVDQYTEDMRDINDQIDELKDKLTEQVLGTDLGSAARDFAQAWLDAYKEFGDTTDAIKGKFKDMIENMIVESVLGEVMEKALKPVYEMIQNMGDEDFNDINFWKRVVDVTGKATTNAVNGAEIVSGLWEQAGINLRELGSDMSGISRDIAGASEESINGLAAGINTQNFYIAQINANVAVIAQKYMSGTATEANATPAIDITALTNQAMSHLQGINQHTAETVAECRRIADSCEQSYKRLSQLIVIRGNGAFINTKMIN